MFNRSTDKLLFVSLLLLTLPLLSGCTSQDGCTLPECGKHGKRTFQKINQLREAAERGDAETQYQLGYEYGSVWRYCPNDDTCAPIDPVEAIKWFHKAAEQGHAQAQCKLGHFYNHGSEDSTEEDKAEAVKWYRKAAEQGNAEAQCFLGGCYSYGKGVPEAKAEGVKWYRKAAEQGSENGMYSLAACYFNGEGVPEDKAEAVKWYRQAAELGDGFAQYELGKCYVGGEGVPEDRAEAAKWFRKAAQSSYAPVRIAVVRHYISGEYDSDEAEVEEWICCLRTAVERWKEYNWEEYKGTDRNKEYLQEWAQEAADLLQGIERKQMSTRQVIL